MPLPDTLLLNIADEAGGRVTLVLGAGCSVEAPTNLLLAGDLARECHRKLIEDGVLEVGDVSDPRDLTEVAEAVFTAEGGFQRALVERFPPRVFRNASPNTGHELAVALMNENAIGSILTLNFDHALSSAIGALGVSDIEIIYGPQDYGQVGTNNLVYLHRDAGADPEEWILRRDALNNAWIDSWQQVLSNRLLAVPVVVFAGLGSPAAVLLDSIARIKNAVADECHVCFVDPVDPDGNPFAGAIGPDSTVQSGWVSFMDDLADRVLREQRARLENACSELIQVESWSEIEVAAELDSLISLGLLNLGISRSTWLLHSSVYLPDRSADARLWIADLLLAVALVAQATGTTPFFIPKGLVEFRDGSTVRAVATFAHGRGTMRWGRLDAELLARERDWPATNRPQLVIVSGVVGERIEPTAPRDIVTGHSEGDIVTPTQSPVRLTTDQIQVSPEQALENLDDF